MVGISAGLVVWKGDNFDWFFAALVSVLNQTEPVDELLLTLNGQDVFVLAPEIWRVIKDADFAGRVTIVQNEVNIGLASALNQQLRQVEYEYYMRMDSDDISLPQRTRVFKAFAKKHNPLAVCGSFSEEFTETGSVRIRKYPTQTEEIRNGISLANPFSHPTVFLRVCDILAIGGYNEDYQRCQDLELWTRVLKAKLNVANMSEVLLRFRRCDTVNKRRSTSQWELKAYLNAIRELDFPRYHMVYPILRYFARRVNFLSELSYKYFKRKR